jgi:hypothetical protein
MGIGRGVIVMGDLDPHKLQYASPRKPRDDAPHALVPAVFLALPSILLWIAFFGHFFGRVTQPEFIGAIEAILFMPLVCVALICCVTSFIVYFEPGQTIPRPWYVYACLGINGGLVLLWLWLGHSSYY